MHSRMLDLVKGLEKEFNCKIFTHGGRIEEEVATLKFRIMELKSPSTPTAANQVLAEPQRADEIDGLRMYPNMIGFEVFFAKFGKVKFVGYNHKKFKYPFIFNICAKPGNRMKCSFDSFIRAAAATSMPINAGTTYTRYEREILDAVVVRKIDSI